MASAWPVVDQLLRAFAAGDADEAPIAIDHRQPLGLVAQERLVERLLDGAVPRTTTGSWSMMSATRTPCTREAAAVPLSAIRADCQIMKASSISQMPAKRRVAADEARVARP